MFLAAMACMVFPFEPYPTVVLGLCSGAGATEIPFIPYSMADLWCFMCCLAKFSVSWCR